VGLARARSDVRAAARSDVPAHLRDAHYRGAAALGHGDGYRYPHDAPAGWVAQRYRPDEAEGHVYYEPSAHGAERQIKDRLAERRAALGDEGGEG
jgi:putative ATPase